MSGLIPAAATAVRTYLSGAGASAVPTVGLALGLGEGATVAKILKMMSSNKMMTVLTLAQLGEWGMEFLAPYLGDPEVKAFLDTIGGTVDAMSDLSLMRDMSKQSDEMARIGRVAARHGGIDRLIEEYIVFNKMSMEHLITYKQLKELSSVL